MQTIESEAIAETEVPPGMSIVTREEFFDFLHRDPRDIMPSNSSPHFTSWETTNRTVVGRSLPGWRYPGNPVVYMLVDSDRKVMSGKLG